jgi:hypothetical protein
MWSGFKWPTCEFLLLLWWTFRILVNTKVLDQLIKHQLGPWTTKSFIIQLSVIYRLSIPPVLNRVTGLCLPWTGYKEVAQYYRLSVVVFPTKPQKCAYVLRHVCLSVRLACNNLRTAEQNVMRFYIREFIKSCLHILSDDNNGHLHEDFHAFMNSSLGIPSRTTCPR